MKKQNNYIIFLISGVITFLSIFIFNSCNVDENEVRFVRKNIHSPEAQSDVEALNTAIRKMKLKGCSDPTSWYYQGAIHWIPDTIEHQTLCNSYKNKKQLKEAWDNCTHTKPSEIHFLVWHRLYIYHFEKIVRKVSGKKDFALPYWDYTDTNNIVINRSLHQLFINKNSALYESCRYDSLNYGFPISGEAARALDITKLLKYTTYSGFNHAIDAAPHGAIHDYVGAGNDTTGKLLFNNPITGSITNTGLMGWVPTAGFDPIFWTHHSNIDRLWQKWSNSKNGQPVTLEDLQSYPWTYVFFDENGNKVTYSNEQILKIIYNLDYDYDDTKLQSVRNVANLTKVTSSRLTSIHKHRLSSKKTILKVNFPNTGLKGKTIIVTTSFKSKPKGMYEVYLNQETLDLLHPTNNSFLGFINFFGSDHRTQNKICTNGCCGEITEDGRYKTEHRFEVTDNIKSSEINVIIYKHNGFVHKDLIIESITIQ